MEFAAYPIATGLGALIATLAGGTVALRFHSRVTGLLGLTSGAIVGVALLDLIPEAVELGGPAYSVFAVMAITGAGFFSYLLLDSLLSGGSPQSSAASRHLGPASLVLHSLLDGVAVGIAFQVSPGVGGVVAVAVLAHDMLDGANTVVLGVAGGATQATARRWLIADAAAPLAGILLSSVLRVDATGLATLLGFFAGGLLFIGAGELLPQSQQRTNPLRQAASIGAGLALIYLVIRLAHA